MTIPIQEPTTAPSEIGYRMELELTLLEKITEVERALDEPFLSRFTWQNLWITKQTLSFQRSMNDHHLHLVLNALYPSKTIGNETWSESEIEDEHESLDEIEHIYDTLNVD